MGTSFTNTLVDAGGLAGERKSSQLSLVSACAKQTRDGDELQIYSRISSVNRRFQLHSSSAQEGADGSRRSTLLADDFPPSRWARLLTPAR